MVGASPHWNRPSYFAMKYLQAKGYRVIPVNPRAAGQEILGEPVRASLADIPDHFDMVQVFRNSAAAGPIVDEALAPADAAASGLDATGRAQRRSGRKGRGGGMHGRHEPMPEDRMGPALSRAGLERFPHGRHILEKKEAE